MKESTETSRPDAEYIAELVTTAEERAAIFSVRMVVFVEEQNVPPEEELDAYDLTATHFLARCLSPPADNAPEIVGAARLLDKGHGIAKVGRVAVLREYRGLGIGALLMHAVEQQARAMHFKRLVLDAQCYAIPFYTKLGYTVEGDVFLDANIEHRFMWKDLAPPPHPAKT